MPRTLRFVAAILLTLVPAIALAQTTVRVTVDKATLWRAGFGSMITVVGENQVLEVVGRQGDWLEVVVPANSSQDRRTALAMRWLAYYSRDRGEKTMVERLAAELMDAAQGRGGAVKKKDDVHRMADANKAFAHYRW